MSLASRGVLGREEAADYLSVSVRVVDRLLASGQVQKLKIGRRTVVKVEELDAYISRLSEESSS